MTWLNAWARGVAIFGFFVVFTVWLPDFVLGLDALTDLSHVARDVILLAVWGGALVAGMWLLRRGQRKGMI